MNGWRRHRIDCLVVPDICASAGSACLADSDEPSYVVRAMKPESAALRQMVRFSLGHETTAAEITTTIEAVPRAARTLRR